jgi:hypothetical protein
LTFAFPRERGGGGETYRQKGREIERETTEIDKQKDRERQRGRERQRDRENKTKQNFGLICGKELILNNVNCFSFCE